MSAETPIVEFCRLANRRVYFTFPGQSAVFEKTENRRARLCDVLQPKQRITVRPWTLVKLYQLPEVVA